MCFCGTKIDFAQCCEPFILGQTLADTPERLMRSRYSAYCINNAQYIHNTYAESKRPENAVKDIKEFANSCRFIRLEVLSADMDKDQVEFKVHYLYQNHHCVLHENSQFIQENNRWVYLDGTIYNTPEVKIGRNDNCPCHSGKKYKKCHAI